MHGSWGMLCMIAADIRFLVDRPDLHVRSRLSLACAAHCKGENCWVVDPMRLQIKGIAIGNR